MEEQNKETKEVSVSSRTKMQETLDIISEKLKNIEIKSQSPYKTNKILPDMFNQEKVDISTCTDITFLVNGLATLRTQKKAYDEVYSAVLEQKTFPVFKGYGGYAYEEWENDIKLRLHVVTQEDTVKKLTEAKKKLEQFLTQDDRLKMVLGEIQDLGL